LARPPVPNLFPRFAEVQRQGREFIRTSHVLMLAVHSAIVGYIQEATSKSEA
jgi:hypothetical protein